MAALNVTPQELMDLANKIASKAEEMNNLCKNLDSKVETVGNSWSGMAANSLYNSYVNMQEAIHSFPKVVQAIANSAQVAAIAYDERDAALAEAYKG